VDEIDPLEFVFPYAFRRLFPREGPTGPQLPQQIKDTGCGSIFLDRSSRPRLRQLELAL